MRILGLVMVAGLLGALFPIAALLLLALFEGSPSSSQLIPLALHGVASFPGLLIAPSRGLVTLAISSASWALAAALGTGLHLRWRARRAAV